MTTPLSAMFYPPLRRARFGCCAILCFSTALHQNASGQRLEDIHRAWEQRQERLASISVEWTERHVQPQGTLVPGEKGFATLEQDREVSFHKAILFSGGRLRWRSAGKAHDARTSAHDPYALTVVWDGNEARSFHDYAKQAFDTGEFSDTTADVLDATSRPIMYALWPLAENLGAISLEQYEVLPGTARVGPCTCVVLQKRVPATVENQIFVDLEREFTVVRVVGMENGTIARQVDIQYERQPRNDVWFPTGWKFSILRRDSQGFSFLSESSVDMVNLGYQSTDEDFILKYPRGTRIYDLRSEQTYFVGHSGTPRLLDETEQHLTAEQILAGKSSRSWILAANGAALLVLSVVIVALRRLRANRH